MINMVFAKYFSGMMLGLSLLAYSPATSQDKNSAPVQDPKVTLEKTMHQEYSLDRIWHVYPIQGPKNTFFTYSPIEDTTKKKIDDCDRIVGKITAGASLNTKISDSWDYDVELITYINKDFKPVRSMAIRRGQNKPAITDSEDVAILFREGAQSVKGDSVTEFVNEEYRAIPGDAAHRLVTNTSNDSSWVVGSQTFDFLSLLYHVVTHPKNCVRTYPLRHYGKSVDLKVTIREDEDDDKLVYRVEANIPKEIDLPISSGKFDFHPFMPPFNIEVQMKDLPFAPSADGKIKE